MRFFLRFIINLSIPVVLFWFFPVFCLAQVWPGKNTASLNGLVVDASNHKPLAKATITVYKKATQSKLLLINSLEDGTFSLEKLTLKDSLVLEIAYAGYNSYSAVVFLNQQVFRMKTVELSVSSKDLGEVLIKVNRKLMVIRGDTSEFNAGSFKTPPNSKAKDLMRRIPGLIVDAGGKLLFNGMPISKILVDGKPFFGTEGAVALSNIPTELIEKVQLYRSAEDNAGFNKSGNDESRVLDIKLKKGDKYFGNAYAGAGTTSRLDVNGFLSATRGKKRFSVKGSYDNINKLSSNFLDPEYLNYLGDLAGLLKTGEINAEYEAGNNTYQFNYAHPNGFKQAQQQKVQSLSQDEMFVNNSLSKSFNAGNTYGFQFQRRNTKVYTLGNIVSILRLSYNDFSKNDQSDFQTKNSDGRLLNNLVRESHSKERTINIFGRKSLNPIKKKNLSLMSNIGFSLFSSNSNDINSSTSRFFKENQQDSISYLNQRIGQLQRRGDVVMVTMLNVKLNKYQSIRITNTATVNSRLNERLTKDGISGQLDSLYSANFRSNILSTETGAAYSYMKPNGLMLNSGLSLFQNYRSLKDFLKATSVSLNQFNFSPSLMLGFKNLSANFFVRSAPPELEQIRPLLDNENPLLLKTGNPDLKTALAIDSRISYRFNHNKGNTTSAFGIEFSANQVKNKIVPVVQYDSLGKQIQNFTNVNGTYALHQKIDETFSYKNGEHLISFTASLAGNYQQDKVFINNVFMDTKTLGVNIQAVGRYAYGDKFSASLNYFPVLNQLIFTQNPLSNQNYMITKLSASLEGYVFKKIKMNQSMLYTYNNGLSGNLKKSSLIWNAGLSGLFFKNKAEVKITAFDILKDYNNISREIGANYVEDTVTNNLTQYVMLGLAYNFSILSN